MESTAQVTPALPIATSRPCETKFGKLELVCVKSTQDTDSTTWCNKLEHHTKPGIGFGGISAAGRTITFYLRTEGAVPVGTTDTLDTDAFDIVERLYVPDGDENKSMWLKNLLVKTAVM